jgi:hypothetical protein
VPAAPAAAGVAFPRWRAAALSSAVLYLAIVAIWAFVLVPRVLRRQHTESTSESDPVAEHGLGEHGLGERSFGEDGCSWEDDRRAGGGTRENGTGYGGAGAGGAGGGLVASLPPAAQGPAWDSGPGGYGQPSASARRVAPPPLARAKVLQARRRLLTVLLLLTAVAVVCTVLKLTSWWACVPPGGMLGLYLLLLREAALADSERARAAEERRVQVARQRARAQAASVAEPTAQVIDLSARIGDQLYDQYADATIRAVGD